ncbi:MAG: hypothetical protein QM619_00535, partial [Micropruina sp.]|uniref:hypothetical protein n=1 Tax=Micropruina sp. TaxID=2737536 RepID=UPI0039E68471
TTTAPTPTVTTTPTTTAPTPTVTTTPTTTPTTPAPDGATVEIKGDPTVGGKITLVGKGWTTKDGTAGSRIVVKLDEGKVKKTSGSDRWFAFEAKADGTFEQELILPDGTTQGAFGSTPAFEAGTHSLLLWSGYFKSNDVLRTVTLDLNVDKALPKPTVTSRPNILGKAKGHNVLTANPGSWKNAEKATFRYQWVRDGKAIEGATGRTYQLTGADAGAELKVWVEATAPEGAWGESVSRTIDVARANSKVTATVVRAQGEQRALVRVEIGSRDWIKPAGRLIIRAGGKTVSVRASDYYVTADLPWLRPDGKYKVTIRFSGDDALQGSSTSLTLRVG